MRSRSAGWFGMMICVLVTAVGWAEPPAPTGGDSKPPAAPRAEPPKPPAVPAETPKPASPQPPATPKPAVAPSETSKSSPPPPPPPPPVEDRKLPGEAKAGGLTPEKHRELLEQIENLKRQLAAAKLAPPTSCKLSGKVEGDLVQVQAEFEFRTDRPRALVALGCQRAWPRTAVLDKQLPMLLPAPGEEGLMVQVESPGEHKLSLELVLPLLPRGARGSERGFDLGLPRAAITKLEQFTLPAGIPEVRVNGRAERTKPVDAQHGRLEAVLLGPADRLDLSWKAPAAASKDPPLLAADSRVFVRLEEGQVVTDVEFELQALRGDVRQWRILLPPQVVPEVREPGPQDERIESKEMPSPQQPWFTIRLKEPSAQPLRLVLQLTQPRKGTTVSVGPFLVLDAFRQRGQILVSAPPELRLSYQRQGDVNQREVTEEMRRDNIVAAFSYGNLPLPANLAQPKATLELEVEAVKGAVGTRTEHALTINETGYQLTTRIKVDPIRAVVENLEVQVPADYPYDRNKGISPLDLVEPDVLIDQGKALIKLVRKQSTSFSVTLPALSNLPAGTQRLKLDLPRPLQTWDQGGQLTVILPPGRELVAVHPSDDSLLPGTRQYTWRWEHAPRNIEVAWREYRPAMTSDTVIDVTLMQHQAQVRQRIDLQFPDAPPAEIFLEIPPSLTDRVRLLQGGTLGAGGAVKLDRPDSKVSLALLYTAPLEPAGGSPKPKEEKVEQAFSLPLVRVLQAAHTETKVRIWSDPGVSLKPADQLWYEQPTEAVADRDSLPTLVVRSGNPRGPLALLRTPTANSPLAPVVIDRALIQVGPADGGGQKYRARFLLSRWNTRHLDLAFPLPAAGLNPTILLGGKKIHSQVLNDGTGEDKVVRLEVDPDLFRKPLLLDVRYEIAPNRTKGNHFLQKTFYPPMVKGDVLLGRVRWQVDMPSGGVSLYPSGGFGAEQRWEWRGGLLALRPAVNRADLEHWLGAPVDAPEGLPLEDPPPDVVCWRADLEPLRIVHVPQQLWLLGCSLGFLLLGLGLSFAGLSRGLFWTVLAGLGLLVAYAGIQWPNVLPLVVYGCEPGMAILILVLGFHWLRQQRYRRQVVFLPSFTRLNSPPILAPTDGSQNRRRGEPSTIDQPMRSESSVGKK